jgi:ubiquinone/menaquinone biosynthesis C-methylase UbiE
VVSAEVVSLDDKEETQKQWNANPCGADSAATLEPGSAAFFERVELERYSSYAPWLKQAVDFGGFRGRRVLEIGPGLGTDHVQFARAGARMIALDLTIAHLQLTRRHCELEGVAPRLVRADAEALPFADDSLDGVYCFGVLHHTPDTHGAIEEIRRVLRPGGVAIVSLYHRHSAFYWIATMLCRGVRKGELWTKGYRRLMAGIEQGSEAAGAVPLVKVVSRRQCRRLFARFASVSIHADHFDWAHVFPVLSPSPSTRRRRLERWAGYWGWYLTVTAQK